MRNRYDFDTAETADAIPALARHRAKSEGQTRVTINIDTDILEAFRERADAAGQSYQPMINAALREYLVRNRTEDLESILRRVIREELDAGPAAA